LNPQIMKTVAPAYFGREPFNDVTSVNGVIGRLGDLMTAADRSAGIAPAGASFEPQTPALADFARAREAVADDMAHVLRAGGMSEDDIRAWKEERASRRPASSLPPRRQRATRTALAQIKGDARQAATMDRARRRREIDAMRAASSVCSLAPSLRLGPLYRSLLDRDKVKTERGHPGPILLASHEAAH
jgi:hypothetical protein